MNILDDPETDIEQLKRSMCRLMVKWGTPPVSAQVHVYILFEPKPVSLDQIAGDIGISKASAWAVTRHLERVSQIERSTEPGSKRVFFSPSDDFMYSMRQYSELMRRLGNLTAESAELTPHPEVEARLKERAESSLAIHEAMKDTIEHLAARQRRRRMAAA